MQSSPEFIPQAGDFVTLHLTIGDVSIFVVMGTIPAYLEKLDP
jgi:predicted nucleic acid-binding Zn finger protein